MSENTQKHSPFENSLLYKALKHALSYVRSPENTHISSEKLGFDTSKTKRVRTEYYILNCNPEDQLNLVVKKFRDSHPELRSKKTKELEKAA